MIIDNLITKAAQITENTGNNLVFLNEDTRFMILRSNAVNELTATLYDPVICLILQGKKKVITGERELVFGAGEYLIVSHSTPVVSQIINASPKKPYLALILGLDISVIRSLYETFGESSLNMEKTKSMEVDIANENLIDSIYRLVEVSQNDLDSKILFSQIYREVHYRLLQAPNGGMLRDLLRVDSNASNINKAISIIRNQFSSPLSIPDIAKTVGMSTSSFHQHFKAITESTPLQYQKDLRLLEAKRLIKSERIPVTEVALKVGYESPNQFSREYTKKFSINPSADAKR